MPYSPKTWALDDPITQTDLNRIETGVDEVTALVETAPTVHLVGGAGEPAFLNSWANYNASTAAEFYKDIHGRVWLTGLIKDGTSGDVFTLPVGSRPRKQEVYSVVAGDAFGRVTIGTDGVVSVSVGSNTFVSFAGISFLAA